MIIQDEIQKAFATAPEHLRAYIKSDELDVAFYQIRTTYKLHLDHAGNLALAIDAVVLGLRKFDELPALLREALGGLDDATREKVLKDVNDKVFIPLRELTKKTAEEARAKLAAPKSPPVTVRPPTTPTQVPAVPQQAQAGIKLEVEKPQPTRLPIKSIVEEKLAQQPAPIVPVVPPAAAAAPATAPQPQQAQVAPPVTQAPPAPTPPAVAAPPPTQPRYHGADPYREPAE